MMINTAPNEITIQDLVQREVIYCASTLIYNLAKQDSLECYEDILNVCAQNDYQSPAEYEGYQVICDEQDLYFWQAAGADPADDESQEVFDTEHEAWQDCCEENGIEPELREAYEHWIVTNWLARNLEGYGEMVSHDIYGMAIWGRATAGQEIYIDDVIQRIYQDLISRQASL